MKTTINKYSTVGTLSIELCERKVPYPITIAIKESETQDFVCCSIDKQGVKELIIELTKML